MDVSRIASAILPYAQDPEIRDLIFKRSSYPRAGSSGVPLTTAAAMSFYKGSLDHVVAIADNHRSDPAVLAKFAKDPRVSVRQTLLRNPALPHAERLMLTRWALGRRDNSAVANAMEHLSAEDFVHVVLETSAERKNSFYGLSVGSGACTAMAEKLAEHPQLCLQAAAFRNEMLTVRLCLLAHDGRIPGVTVEQLLAVDDLSRFYVLRYLLEDEAPKLTVDLAKALVACAAEAHGRVPVPSESFASVEPGSPEILLAGPPSLVKVAVDHGADESALAAGIGEMSFAHLDVVFDAMRGKLSLGADTEAALVARFVELGGQPAQDRRRGVSAGQVIRALRHPLSDESILTLLRLGSAESTAGWLSAGAVDGNREPVNGLRPGMLRALAADPGHAFAGPSRQSGASYNSWVVAGIEGLSDMIDALSRAATPETAAEAVEFVDESLGRRLHQEQTARLVYPLLRRALGTQVEAWETYMTLASDWNGTFTELLGATCALLGIEPAAQRVAGPATAGICEQLSLL